MAATSRTTLNVNKFVRKDAVGVRVTSNGGVVVNRTMFISRGMMSKIGVRNLQRSWFFAAGPQRGKNWIAVLNPTNRWAHLSLRAYGRYGAEVGAVRGWLKPHARVGYLINRIARQSDAAVVLQASRPVVAEQTTYLNQRHDASTDMFGVPAPAKNWLFAAASTLGGRRDVLNVFNPNTVPIPVAVQFMTATGGVSQRTYVVGPFSHQRVSVASVEPNAQLGMVVASNSPFVAMNRAYFDNGRGSMTSQGVHS